jgi:hypothetical protein
MRAILEGEAGAGSLTDAELRAYFQQHSADYETGPIVELTQIFFTGSNAGDAADAALTSLNGLDAGPDAALDYGDAFVAGTRLPPYSQRGLAKLFGDAFAEKSMTLPLHTWSGPITSVHGVHLVWIHERTADLVAPFEAVRASVRQRLLAERTEDALHAGIARLRQKYSVPDDSSAPAPLTPGEPG